MLRIIGRVVLVACLVLWMMSVLFPPQRSAYLGVSQYGPLWNALQEAGQGRDPETNGPHMTPEELRQAGFSEQEIALHVATLLRKHDEALEDAPGDWKIAWDILAVQLVGIVGLGVAAAWVSKPPPSKGG